jgi:hypothetical protein
VAAVSRRLAWAAGIRPGLFADPVRLPGQIDPGDQLIAFLGRHPGLLAAPGPAIA